MALLTASFRALVNGLIHYKACFISCPVIKFAGIFLVKVVKIAYLVSGFTRAWVFNYWFVIGGILKDLLMN